MIIEPSTPANDHLGYGDPYSETNGENLVVRSFIKENDVVFDVGANVGDWSIQALRKANVEIHAFEPVEHSADEYARRILFDRVHLNRCALSCGAGKTLMFASGPIEAGQVDASQASSFWEKNLAYHKVTSTPVLVRIQKLDDYCEHHGIKKIDFLKIDVEGAEFAVLQGAGEMLKKTSIVQFEYNYTYREAKTTLLAVRELLRPFGFKIHRMTSDKLLRVENWRDELESFRFCNYLALKCAPLGDI